MDQDFTELVYSDRALQDREHRYRIIFEGLPFAVYTCDIDGYILLYNQAAADLWGREPEIGKDLWCGSWKIFKTDGTPMPVDQCPMAIALKEGRVIQQEILIERPDGTRRYVMPYPLPIRNEKGKIIGAMNTLSDITSRKQSEGSKDYLAAIVHSSDDAIIGKSLDGIVTSWNPGAERVFGYTTEEMVGQSILKIIPEDRIEEEPLILSRIRRGEKVDHFETKRMAKNGRLIDISLTISPILDEQKKIIGASKIARDITSQKLLNDILRGNEQSFRDISDSAPVMIWMAGPDGKSNFFNKGWLDFTGRTKEEQDGYDWSESVHPDDFPQVMAAYLKYSRIHEGFYLEFRVKRQDGEFRWINSKATPRFRVNGEFEGFIGACMDISDLKDHEQRKDDFIKMASHELKAPVTSIKGYVQLLMKACAREENKSLISQIAVIDKQVGKLNKLISDLLDLTRIETTPLQLDREVFFIDQLVSEVIAEMQNSCQTHRLRMQAKGDFQVLADKDRISQVLINYLINAIKYSRSADQVIVTVSRMENKAVVSVQDFGIGIHQKDQARIFERFYRGQDKDEQTFPGFGIGLYIVHEIIQGHGGETWVESEKNRGSVFYFSLPLFESS